MISKKTIGLGVIVAIAIVLSGWCSKFFISTDLTFINQSSIHIDSVFFSLNNYSYKMVSIKPNSTITNTIYPDSIRLNNHDIMITATLFLNGSFFKYGYNYNDLNGDLGKGYILTLRADSTVQLREAF